MEISVGTTPSITYTFKSISVSDLIEAKLTIKRGDVVMLTKDISDAIIENGALVWTLTQAETLHINTGAAECMLNWVTSGGVRGASNKTRLSFIPNHINEVI